MDDTASLQRRLLAERRSQQKKVTQTSTVVTRFLETKVLGFLCVHPLAIAHNAISRTWPKKCLSDHGANDQNHVQNYPMKNHAKFLLENCPYEALKKTYWKNCYFSFQKFIGRSPKAFKQKLIPVFTGKNTTKRNIEKMWQNRLISKKNHFGETLQKRCRFLCLFWVVGKVSGVERGYAFWSANVDFHALLELVGGVCGAEKEHAFWSKECGFLCPFWACILRF